MEPKASEVLENASDLPRHEAERLLLSAAGERRSWLVGDPDLQESIVASFHAMVDRRRQGEPVQYIEGTAAFGPIELAVDSRVLIPRPETERLLEIALLHLHGIDRPIVVDLCTGSGNLALAIKQSRPDSHLYATDSSSDALALADRNRASLGLDVQLLHGDLFAPLPAAIAGKADLIVSNPPYVSEREFSELPDEVRNHEPRVALVAGKTGMAVLDRIAAHALDWLRPGGWVISEIGEAQGPLCLASFAAYEPEILSDLADRDRFVLGRAPMVADVH